MRQLAAVPRGCESWRRSLWWLALGCVVALALAIAVGCGSSSTGNGATSDSAGEGEATTGAAQTQEATPKPRPTKSARKEVTKIVFVDVGQGDAAIIKSGSWTGLIDGGLPGSEGAIEAALRKLGVRRLSAVVVSHPHADHTGGLSGVVYDYRPRQALVGEGAGKAAAALKSVGARITKVRRGDTLHFGKLPAKVLSPGPLTGDANEDSVVLLVDANGKRFLFTGDVTGSNEMLVGSICARGPPLYLLKVAHHGSRSSTSSSFLSEARPQFALISVGANSYGHPTPETVAALKAAGTRIYSTRKNGTVTLTIAASGAVAWSFARSAKPVTKAARSSGGSTGGGTSTTGGSGGGARVYVTKTGECYHLSGCRYLAQSKIPITLKDAKARYRPCNVCKPPT